MKNPEKNKEIFEIARRAEIIIRGGSPRGVIVKVLANNILVSEIGLTRR